jgi:alkylation response protein AidB-like acyl-CoA dehydrogenase
LDFDDSPTEAALRAEARAWLEGYAPAPDRARGEPVSVLAGFDDSPDAIARAREWQRALAGGGWAAITWPVEHGGRGAGPLEAIVLAEELARVAAPSSIFAIGIGMIGPTIIAHGSAAQQGRYLPPMLDGREIWCQLWSEPSAGSDLAGLSARAVRDGDDYVVSGQKVWTSGAQYSQFGLGLFRTDVAAPKHRGITCLIVDMSSPGIEVRPLRQMTGAAHFNEVFLDSVRVPVDNRVGDENDGWRVARTTMMNERLAAGGLGSFASGFGALARLAVERHRHLDRWVRQELSRVYTQSKLFELTTARVRTSLGKGMIPGPEGSILKLAAAQLGTAMADTGVSLLGPDGALDGVDAPEGGRWTDAVLSAFAMHIGGGTDEIQRNIIAESVLGLPR